jgi:hypothetical protein
VGHRDLHNLAVRIRRGDRAAASDWKRTFGPQMVRIVRRTLRARDTSWAFGRIILAAAERLQASCLGLPARSHEQLITRVAHDINVAVLRGLQGGLLNGQAIIDTIVSPPARLGQDNHGPSPLPPAEPRAQVPAQSPS